MTSRIALMLLGLATFAGCAGPDLSTPQGQCREQAYNDPKVKAIIMTETALNQLAPAVKQDAITDATNRCLADRGLAPPGGVERRKVQR